MMINGTCGQALVEDSSDACFERSRVREQRHPPRYQLNG